MKLRNLEEVLQELPDRNVIENLSYHFFRLSQLALSDPEKMISPVRDHLKRHKLLSWFERVRKIKLETHLKEKHHLLSPEDRRELSSEEKEVMGRIQRGMIRFEEELRLLAQIANP